MLWGVMKTYLECLPCFIRQTLEAAKKVSDNKDIHEKALRVVLSETIKMDLNQTPPQMGGYIHNVIKRVTENPDPYLKEKRAFNQFAMDLYPDLKTTMYSSLDPIEVGLKLAIAGNIIDFGVNGDVKKEEVLSTIEQALNQEFSIDKKELFKKTISSSKNILYLGDNAGEIVFDKLLIENLPQEKITYVVRGGAIINDVLMEDAVSTGITDLVNVIDNGASYPGTILNLCSDIFREQFEKADLIISKGQGNFETLSDTNKKIFFLFKAKCSVVAKHINCQVGDLIFQDKNIAN